MNGATRTRATNGLSPSVSTTTTARNAARMLRSPWARFTMRMTPKMSDSPVAKSA